MSDEEYFTDAEEENDDLQYSEQSSSDGSASLENQYYLSKELKQTDPIAALKSFQNVLDLDDENSHWGFKTLKQMVKINFKLSNYEEMMIRYKQLLTYIKSSVTCNHVEKAINSILDCISTSSDNKVLFHVYNITLEALKESKNEKLWFKTNLKLGKLFNEKQDFANVMKIVKQLRQSCEGVAGEMKEDNEKGTQLLEICALEIQMYTKQNHTEKLKELYKQTLRIKSVIPHPRIMGIIRECGGKINLRDSRFDLAYIDFYDAFKNYEEVGCSRQLNCLKYAILANMLIKSHIDPFDSPEAKPYKNNLELLAMTSLVKAYQRNDLKEFEFILKQYKEKIMDDPFIQEHVEDLLRNIRIRVILNLVKPYSRIGIHHIAQECNIDDEDIENLLVCCILDGSVSGRIDQKNQILILNHANAKTPRYNVINKWLNGTHGLLMAAANRLS